MWEKRLAELEGANAGWITTVTADALRAQLASAELAISQEAARGGCKAKCLARTQERDQRVVTATEGASRCRVRLPQFVPVMLAMRDDASMSFHVSGHHEPEIVQ